MRTLTLTLGTTYHTISVCGEWIQFFYEEDGFTALDVIDIAERLAIETGMALELA